MDIKANIPQDMQATITPEDTHHGKMYAISVTVPTGDGGEYEVFSVLVGRVVLEAVH